MAELKTKPTTVSVSDFLDAVHDEERRKDCFAVAKIMKKATGADPKMWGPKVLEALVESSVRHMRSRR